jgi:hypothetical protein
MGRFLRFAHLFNKPPLVLLAGKDFAKLNSHLSWGVKTPSGISNIDDVLTKRKKEYLGLFQKSGFTINLCEVDNAHEENNMYPHINYEEIKKDALNYHKIAAIYLGKSSQEYIIDDNEKKKCFDTLDTFRQVEVLNEKADPREDITNAALEPIVNLIKRVIETQNSYSENSFRYFLLRYYHQHKLNKYLIFGSPKDSGFDQGFRILQKIHGTNYSGTQLNFLENQAVKDLSLGDAGDIEKLVHIFSMEKYSYAQSILIADLLSFAHFFFKWKEPTNQFPFDQEFSKLLEKLDSREFADSWNTYTRSVDFFNQALGNFEARMFTYWEQVSKVPYWYFPYFLQKQNPQAFQQFCVGFTDLLLRAVTVEIA